MKTKNKSYALLHCNVLSGEKDMEVQKNQTILVKDGRIESISDTETIPEGYVCIDIKDHYVMPGLINMHVHLAGNGKPQKKQRDNAKLVNAIFSNPVSAYAAHKLVESYAKMELMSGVTTIRTVGGLKDLDTRVRDDINAGKILGPRILASNLGISVEGGHMAGSVALPAHSAKETVEMVDARDKENVDLIKLMITGGVMDAKEKGVPGQLKMPAEMVKAACEEAHRKGYIVAAHVESPIGVRVALENGVDSIEHGAKPDEEIISLFKEKHAFLTTTLSPALPYALFDRSVSNASEVEQYNGNVVFEGIRDCAKAAIANNIPVALGNDVGCPWISQYDFWRELCYFHKYVGVSNAFALYSATLGNATLAGIGKETGSLEPGKSADLSGCAQNPLEDLRVLRVVEHVMIRGQWIERPMVKRNPLLDQYLDPYLY